MIAYNRQILVRMIGTTGRALWSGAPVSRGLAMVAIAAVIVFATSAGITALAQLGSAAMLVARLVVIYSLILRGR
jgi:hypothetical protein